MILFAVKRGIPDVASSNYDPNYYPLSFNLKSNVGYIGYMARGWKFYTSQMSVIKEYQHLCNDNKYYYYGDSFEECFKDAEKIIGVQIKVIDQSEIETFKFQLNNTTKPPQIPIPDDNPDIFTFIHELDNFIGLREIKEEIYALRSLAKVRAKKLALGIPTTPSTLHMVFTGNPGTGKTTVARLIGKIYYGLGLLSSENFIEVSRKDLVGEFIGSTALKTTHVFEKALGGVLFIDEAYSLFNNERKDFGNEAIETIVKLMEDYRDKLIVIIAGYPKEISFLLDSNPGLKSRFSTYLHFPDFSIDELILIMKKMINDIGHEITYNAICKLEFIIEEHYDKGKFTGNARSIRNLFEKIQKNQAVRLDKIKNPTRENYITITDSDIPDFI